MGTISINGKTYHGNTLSIVGDDVYIDGVLQQDQEPRTTVTVVLQGGMLEHLTIKKNNTQVNIEGDVGGDLNAGGSVKCQHVEGSVKAGGSVTCGDVRSSVKANGSATCKNVTGDVKANGSVTCGKVGGKIRAGGSVRHR